MEYQTAHYLKIQVIFFLFLLLAFALPLSAQVEVIQPNDNETPAGSLEGNVLSINLVAETGTWFPEGDAGHSLPIQAFREEGKPLQIPGPMIRVEEGTEVVATIRNAIAGSELRVIGLQTRPASEREEIVISSGEQATVRFMAGDPGIYFYAAGTESPELNQRFYRDSQLSGAFIVDPPGYSGDDSVLVLNDYLRGIPPDVTGSQTAINGKSWPNSDIREVDVGKTNRWHVINPSFAIHPMHLHGQHYRVSSIGNLLTSNQVPVARQEYVVTQPVLPMSSMTMEWTAVQEGNWLFHCHLSAHVSAELMVSVIGDTLISSPEETPSRGMGGMVLGIRAVDPENLSPKTTAVNREVTMVMEQQDNYFDENPGFAVAFNEAGEPPNDPLVAGSTLVLNKDEAVSINLVNSLDEPTSIHWHGMELESYYDGAAGFSGNGTSITPIINPGESFEVRMTPPRAGTYFYHTHHRDREQLRAGLYGAVIVSDPADPYTPAREKVLVIGLIGKQINQGVGINGSSIWVDEVELGQTYRLRLVNITDNGAGLGVRLLSDQGPEQWIPLAKDGADLPAALQQSREASRQLLAVGVAQDYSWTPTSPGTYRLEVAPGFGAAPRVLASAEFHVKE